MVIPKFVSDPEKLKVVKIRNKRSITIELINFKVGSHKLVA